MAGNMKKKAERVEEKREKRPYAVAKYIRISPYKVRTVLDLIRGKSVAEAQAILEHSVNGGAAPTKKVLLSAVANAEHNFNMDASNLYVSECFVCPGPTLKRVQPRAQGRAFSILKRTSHVTLTVSEKKNGKEAV